MDDHISDEQQAEQVREWLRSNGPAIAIGVVLGLGGIFGWQYWRHQQDALASAASIQYQGVVRAIADQKADQARTQAETLLKDSPESTYAQLAALQLAKLAVESKDYAAAAERLRWIISHAQREELRSVARLRLARVLLAQNQLDTAETELKQVTLEPFKGQRDELLGDLYVQRKDYKQARQSYSAAQATGHASGLLTLKLNNLPSEGA